MARLLLDEQSIEAVFDQVRHVAMTEAVQGQLFGQPGRLGRALEGGADAVLAHQRPALGRPQADAGGRHGRPDVLDPF